MHTAADARAAFAEAGIGMLLRPKYSPDLGPIEGTFSAFRAGFKRKRKRRVTMDSVHAEVVDVLNTDITADVVAGMFRHCYYPVAGFPHTPYQRGGLAWLRK